MDHPAHRHPTIVLRLSVTVRWPVGAIVRRSTVALVRRLRVPAVPWPSAVTLRRLAADAARRFAIAGILALAIVLVAVVPVRAANWPWRATCGTWPGTSTAGPPRKLPPRPSWPGGRLRPGRRSRCRRGGW